MAYCEPQDTHDMFYIKTGNFGEIKLLDLVERANEHFGTCALTELTISPEWLKIDGCSCCYDSSDYENYICVTINRKDGETK